ncbi:DUF305 domain-containing protein [Streptomyces sp. ISL-100]|uniref:DUF305 domain-containing protein n=1 Tax=Streptomyces sp. ISL-100 TaxID=2819173 RepID=UPI001BE73A47|nr:DUF305 domain-containing protein [Streptomyces sp. ISL-100]MBT2399550.1 DUF305 domain-containing protein [Streptomyces sp. ISL-100]
MTRTYWAAVTAVVLALLFAAGAVTVAAGDGNDGGDGDGGSSAARTPGEDSADTGFARDMSVHHQQAVEMSFIVRDRTKDEEVRRLAYDIANTQANQRGMMLGWLDLWGLPKVSSDEPMAWMAASSSSSGHGGHGSHGAHEVRDGSLMPGMATRTELAKLREADGKQAEILFLQLMTAHHKGGVTMAQGCADQCEVTTERSLAQGMVDAQESEMTLMADMLKARGAAPRP